MLPIVSGGKWDDVTARHCQVQGAQAGPGRLREGGWGRISPGPGCTSSGAVDSLAPAAIQPEHPGSLGIANMCGVAWKRVGPSGASDWFEAFLGTDWYPRLCVARMQLWVQ
jgi:hypothetical protein